MKNLLAAGRQLFKDLARVTLRSFLESDAALDFTPKRSPAVSVLIVVWNHADLTLSCLKSLAVGLNRSGFEIIVVDNGSTDETGLLLERMRGLNVIRNKANEGYPRAVNQAAEIATGQYLLLLNNDTEVLGRSLDTAVEFLAGHEDVGAVGGKIVWLDGRLQEAGCTILRNGWVYQHGKGGDPADGAYDFVRDVDYCSGVFLMTPRDVFAELGGLDEAFSPGYYEESDYCVRLKQNGWRCVYVPEAVVLHYETASSSRLHDLPRLWVRNREKFMAKHAQWLLTRPTRDYPEILLRSWAELRFGVLLLGDGFCDDLSVEKTVAAFGPIIARIEELDAFVTLALTGASARLLQPLRSRLPRTVEIVAIEETGMTADFIATRLPAYDLVVGDASSLEALAGKARQLPPCAVYGDGRFSFLGRLDAREGPTESVRKAA